jgi:crotonobetainyl-CoA:carnitine CoA-transferase CaiB-like acyl-CoA transferase
MNQAILNGLRILDFTWVLAGPYATRVLADFGAEVIKVQSQKTSRGAGSNLTGYFNSWNRNKRSITLDMSHPEAKEIVLKLTEKSDVVIENFSPRVMANWGLNYEKLKEIKSNLIMVSLSAMGQTGPWKDFVGFGPTIQALSGFTYLTSFDKDSPLGVGYSYADMIVGLYAALAILSALEYRDRTGQGQYIDISEYESMCTLIGPTLMDVSMSKREVLPQGNCSDYILAAPHGCYKCLGTNRWCVIAVFDDAEWKALCRVMSDPFWTKEEKFSTLLKRKERSKELDGLIEQWTAQHTPEEIVQVLQGAGVLAGLVQDGEDLAKDPQLMARDFFIPLEHPALGRTISDSTPIRFKDIPIFHGKAAPLLGEDNRYVYMELLGFKEDDLSFYIEKGIIG